jgi:hypothetical protein
LAESSFKDHRQTLPPTDWAKAENEYTLVMRRLLALVMMVE